MERKDLDTRRYYFGAIVPFFKAIFESQPDMIRLGMKFSKGDVHKFLKQRFDIESTKRFTLQDWAEFILKLEYWASFTFDKQLPDAEQEYYTV